MYSARTIWIVESLVSLGLIALVGSRLSDEEAGAFIVAELLVLRRARVRIRSGACDAASGSCSEGDIICLSPADVFVLGLIVAGALYPGWAFGTGVGALARLSRS